MSAPRCVLPDSTYLLTRRCSERRFFLQPSPLVNQLILYCLALTAQRFGVLLHAFCFLANHFHLVATDLRGNLPLFMHDFDLLLARALNAHLGRFEAFWAPGSYSAVKLVDPDAVLEKIAYTLANPVAAGLVAAPHLWPGLISSPADLGAPPRTIPRPAQFFRSAEAVALPAEVTLALVPPPGFADLDLAALRALVAARVAQHVDRARQDRRGRPFLGACKVLKQRPFDRPRDHEPRFRLNPRLAGRDRWKRIEASQRLRSFLDAYRAAWTALRDGVRELVVFPPGTWRPRRELGAWCVAPS